MPAISNTKGFNIGKSCFRNNWKGWRFVSSGPPLTVYFTIAAASRVRKLLLPSTGEETAKKRCQTTAALKPWDSWPVRDAEATVLTHLGLSHTSTSEPEEEGFFYLSSTFQISREGSHGQMIPRSLLAEGLSLLTPEGRECTTECPAYI